MVAANKIYDNMKINDTYEYGVTIFKAEGAEKYYLTSVRRGTRWNIKSDGNAGINYRKDKEINTLKNVLKHYDDVDNNEASIIPDTNPVDESDVDSLRFETPYVAHVHSHPMNSRRNTQVFSIGDYCEAYACKYSYSEYTCDNCEYNSKECTYTTMRNGKKCELCDLLHDAKCLRTHRHACNRCDDQGNCGQSTFVTYLVADLTTSSNGGKSSKNDTEVMLMKFMPPTRNEIYKDLHKWMCTGDTPELKKKLFMSYVKVTPIIKKLNNNSVITWKETAYPYTRETRAYWEHE